MKILITGASGFVGKHLVKMLSGTRHEIILLLRSTDKANVFANLEKQPVFIYLSDSGWKKQVAHSMPEVIIHLAAYLTSADDEAAIEKLITANILFGTQLLDALKEAPVNFFINTGTFAEYHSNKEYTEPSYLYAATKTAFRSILQYYQALSGFAIVNVIPYTIYGGKDSQKKIIDHLYDSIDSKDIKKMSPGEQRLDFIHIDDVAGFYIQLIENLNVINKKYTEIHLGTGVGTSLRQLNALIQEIAQKSTNIEWGGLPYRKRDTMEAIATKNLPSALFDWKPAITLEKGVADYLNLLKHK